MPIDIVMPPLSQTSDRLLIIEWFRNIGDTVTKGEPLFSVETDKATLDVESPASGHLVAILAQPGEEILAHAVIGQITEPGEEGEPTIPASVPPILQAASQEAGRESTKDTDQIISPQTESQTTARTVTLDVGPRPRILSSPRARSLLQQKGFNIQMLEGLGTGPQGALVERDVQVFLHRQETSFLPVNEGTGTEIKLTPTQKTVAHRMEESHASIPPVTYFREVDVTALVELRQRILSYPGSQSFRPSFTDFFVAFTCRALLKYPKVNATLEGETLKQHDFVHLALAVDTDRGLVAPVVQNADSLRIAELSQQRSELIERAKNGKLTREELSGGTFTLTNLGMLSVDGFTPIINPPQVAILGIGRIRETPAVWQGTICIRSLIQLSLTCDHRVIDGALAAHFLEELVSIFQAPELYML